MWQTYFYKKNQLQTKINNKKKETNKSKNDEKIIKEIFPYLKNE